MFRSILFAVYAMLIPVVPLYGVGHYRKNKDRTKEICCWVLFALQLLVSVGSVIAYV